MIAILIKGTLILGLAAALNRALKDRPASARHLVWTVALASVLLLPVLSVCLPEWQVPHAGGPGPAIALNVPDGPVPEPKPEPRWPQMLLALWGAGALLFLARLAVGYWRIRRSIRDARVLRTPDWLDLRDEVITRLGMWQIVPLVQARLPVIPMTWGVRYPLVLLPAGAEKWTAERRRIVLMHELAHVQRRDALAQFIGQLACAVYWFHPLVWVAVWRLSLERERACDDRVLEVGTRATDYAGHLLGVARSLKSREDWALAAITMAHPSQLEGRLRAILDASIRRKTLGRTAAAVAGVVLAFFVLPLAVARMESHPAAGTVYDTTGGIVPGALVTVRNLSAGTAESMRTDGRGAYLFGKLAPGHYVLEVRQRGFRLYRRQFVVDRSALPRMDATLHVGVVRETLTIASKI